MSGPRTCAARGNLLGCGWAARGLPSGVTDADPLGVAYVELVVMATEDGHQLENVTRRQQVDVVNNCVSIECSGRGDGYKRGAAVR